MDDVRFLGEFEAAAIPRERWKHRDHIRMAFLYLREHGLEGALPRIRSGIRALNRANRVPESATSGYHETVTVAWARLIEATLHAWGAPASFAEFEAQNPHLLSKTLLRLYYSRERIFSAEAKTRFVAPDLAPLPQPVDRDRGGIEVRDENPRSEVAQELMEQLGAELVERYGGEGSGPFAPNQVEVPGGFFVVARLDGVPSGCGALLPIEGETGEVKRMFVTPRARGRGVSRAILAALEERARRHGYAALKLETGVRQPEAMGLYEAAGYERIPCFGPYAADPLSVCYAKRLERI